MAGSMMRLFWVCLCVIGCATGALGGAWAREEGQLFVSSATNLWVSDGTEIGMYYDPTFYAEYGLTDRVTLGIDYYGSNRDMVHTGFVFARFPLGDTAGRDRFAAGFALGGKTDLQSPTHPLLRADLAWGRGLDNGWLAIDASATYSREDQAFRSKTDFTWGFNLTDRWTGIVQLQTSENDDGVTTFRLSPTIMYNVGEHLRVGLSAVASVSGRDPDSLRLAIWQAY